jgi:hypothetical protein
MQGILDCTDVTCTTELSNEPAARFQRAEGRRNYGLLIANPVEYGVAEDGVELAVEWQTFRVHYTRIEPTHSSTLYLFSGTVDPNYGAPSRNQLLCEHTVAAPYIKNALPGLRRQKFENLRSEIGNEASILGIRLGVPTLNWHGPFPVG